MAHISQECMFEECNFRKNEHKRTGQGGSPLSRYLGIEMTKLMEIEMHSYWHTQKCLGGQARTRELELVLGVVKKT